jgi:hypothetical protein
MAQSTNRLRRYWFRFALNFGEPHPPGVLLGCGVTAADVDSAQRLMAAKVFKGYRLPTITEVVEDIDVCTLDAGHVRPNMGDPACPGVWFPLGFH